MTDRCSRFRPKALATDGVDPSMRIDREAFLLAAISTLTGCERADTLQNDFTPVKPLTTEVQQPGAMVAREVPKPELVAPAPEPEPVPEPVAVVEEPKPEPPKKKT